MGWGSGAVWVGDGSGADEGANALKDTELQSPQLQCQVPMWFSGQSGVDARTWSGGHGYGVHDHSWGAFCEDEEEVFHVLEWGAASFSSSEPPSSAECRAGGASERYWGPTRAGGVAVPGARGPGAGAGVQQSLGGGGEEEREQGQ